MVSCEESTAPVQVVLETELGAITVEVYPAQAPKSAGDFLRYVDKGLFDEGGFYRVVRPDNDNGDPLISVIQGGLLEGQEGLAPIPLEPTSLTGLRHRDGTISLGREEPDTGSAAGFFIVIGDQPSLDEGGMRNTDGLGFAAFGQVIGGMEIVRAINAMQGDAPTDDPYVKGQILADPVTFTAKRVSP
ncbi:MAG: peptidylprolyl isomerase [Pseudomonadota bacterium]